MNATDAILNAPLDRLEEMEKNVEEMIDKLTRHLKVIKEELEMRNRMLESLV
jgi:HAMP domain-containing protein